MAHSNKTYCAIVWIPAGVGTIAYSYESTEDAEKKARERHTDKYRGDHNIISVTHGSGSDSSDAWKKARFAD